MIATVGDSFDGFNTQPPEGGWFEYASDVAIIRGFNTQPPEGGWENARA